jgi:lia operon protein LiaF
MWPYFWAVALILLGIWMIFRPRWVRGGTEVSFLLLGDHDRFGAWQVTDQEFWSFVGDIDLDMTHAEIPTGETTIRAFGFVGDVKLRLPEDVGFSVSSTAFLTSANLFGEKQDNLLVPYQISSANYETAERKIRLEATYFVVTVKLRRARA